MARSKFILLSGGGAAEGFGSDGQAVPALGAIGGGEFELLHRQGNIDTECDGSFDLTAGFRIPQPFDDAS